MTKFRVSEFSSHAGTGLIDPKFYDSIEAVAQAVLEHKKLNDSIHERNKNFPASERIQPTGLDINVMGLTGPRSLHPEEFNKLKIAYDNAVERDGQKNTAPSTQHATARVPTPG